MKIIYNEFTGTPDILIDDENDFTLLKKFINVSELPHDTQITIETQGELDVEFTIKDWR